MNFTFFIYKQLLSISSKGMPVKHLKSKCNIIVEIIVEVKEEHMKHLLCVPLSCRQKHEAFTMCTT